jgi:hypothetical protein
MAAYEPDPQDNSTREPDPFGERKLTTYEAMSNAMAAGATLGDMSDAKLSLLTNEYATTGQSQEIAKIAQGIERNAKEFTGHLTRQNVAAGADPEASAIVATRDIAKTISDPEGSLAPSNVQRPFTRDDMVQAVVRNANKTQSEAEDIVTQYENMQLASSFAGRAYDATDIKIEGASLAANAFANTMVHTAKGLGVAALPLVDTIATALWAEATMGRPIGADVPAGEALVAVSKWISEEKGAAQTARLKFAIDRVEEMKLPAAHKLWIIQSVVDENSGVVGTGTFDRWASNFGSVVDVLPFGGKLAKGALGPVGKLLARGRMRDAREMMAALTPYLARMRGGQAWGLDVRDFASTQLPKSKVVGTPASMPDGVMEEASRITNVRGDIQQNLDTIRSNNADPETVGSRINKELARITSLLQGKERPSMSRIGVSPDGNHLEFDVVIGRNQTDGFVNRSDANLYIERLAKLGVEAKLKEVDSVGKLMDTKPTDWWQVGDFYVEAKHTAAVEPADQLLFGGRPVSGPSWLGRAARYVMPPQWLFHPTLYGKFLGNTLAGSALKANLDKIASPLLRLSGGDKIYVNKMLEWSSTFGERTGRGPTWTELRQAFPDASTTQLKSWYTGRAYYDTVYEINNQRLFNSYTGRGFKTLRAGGKAYHGRPETHGETRSGSALDPATNAEVILNQADIDSLYATGGGLMRIDRPVESASGSMHTLLIHRGTQGATGLSPLATNPLEYVAGYVPRLYESPYVIRRIMDNAIVNGKAEKYEEALSVADTKAEADAVVARLVANNTDPGVRYEVGPDPRLSNKDRTALDIGALQTEDRLFFGERGKHLASARGGMADVVDPLNMLSRTSAIVSRQVSMEDLVKHQINQWGVTFDPLLTKFMPTWRMMTVTERTKKLGEIASSNTGDIAKQAHQARTWMDYIGVMEGTNPAWNGFRKAAIASAEMIARILPKSGTLGAVSSSLTRAAGRFDPVQLTRSLVYFSYITARPVRQLILQGAQMSFVAPMLFRAGLNPAYIAKWPAETWNVLQGLKLRSAIKGGVSKEDAGVWTKNMSKLMGFTPEEFTTVIRELENSGVLQGLEMHSIAGDLPRASRSVGTNALGRAKDLTLAAPRKVGETLQLGFDLGEQWNLTASWLAALRVTMADSKIKKVGAITPAQWKEIGELGSEYALAMNRANASKYQYGWASLGTQFLSFTHKAVLVPIKLLAGNRVGGKLTRTDAARIMAGQIVMFGGAGLGIKEFVSDKIEADEDLRSMHPDIKDLIAGGVVDHVIDKSFQTVLDDPELDLPLDTFLAPAANTASTVAKFVGAAMDVGIVESATGPAFSVGGSIGDAIGLSGYIYGRGGLPLDEGTRHMVVAEGLLSGLLSGYSDYTKARAAAAAGRWVSAKGDTLPVEAKWHEVWSRGVLGMTPARLLDYYALTGDIKDRTDSLNKDAQVTADRVNNVVNRWLGGQITDKKVLQLELASVLAVLDSHDDLDAAYIATQLEKIYQNDAKKGDGTTIQDRIAKHLTSGMTPSDRMRSVVTRTSLLTETEREAALRMIEQITKEAPEAQLLMQERIEGQSNEVSTP